MALKRRRATSSHLVTLLATHLVLTKESALLKDIKVLKELCELAKNLPASRYYALLVVISLFGAGFLLKGIALLVTSLQ